MIEIPFVDGIARARLTPDDLPQLLGTGADGNAGDADARHHHFSGGELAELEQLLQDLARLGPQRALLFRLLDDQLQFFGRVVLIGGLLRCG